jgi:hypothetical protein
MVGLVHLFWKTWNKNCGSPMPMKEPDITKSITKRDNRAQ